MIEIHESNRRHHDPSIIHFSKLQAFGQQLVCEGSIQPGQGIYPEVAVRAFIRSASKLTMRCSGGKEDEKGRLVGRILKQ
jgi:hypothetical protein